MNRKIVFLVLLLHCFFGVAYSKNYLLQSEDSKHIFINNRILAKVNGKGISVIDVMKRMDMLFYKQFPQYASSPEARFQFYGINWKQILSELIEKELIMKDAEEVKMEISHGDLRQEMENLFGPNIVATLDKAGLTYDEAWKMVKDDQTLKRMLGTRVHAKAIRAITPIDIRKAYEEYAKSNVRPDSWKYQIISIRGKDLKTCENIAQTAYALAAIERIPLEELEKKLQLNSEDSTSINISEEYSRTEKEISDAYRDILNTMEPNTFSKPSAQNSRAEKSTVFRIFYLKELNRGGAVPFAEVELKLKNRLIDQKVMEETEKYITRLRQHFNVQDDIYPEDFKPFVLK